jgi:hypothetical protein
VPIALGLAALSVLAVSAAFAQTGGGFDATFNTFDSGGGTTAGGNYVLQTAAGQPIAGTSGEGGYALDAGVLSGSTGAVTGPSPTPTPTPGDLPFKRFGPQVAKDGVN